MTPEAEDPSEYPDDFEEEEDEDVMMVGHYAGAALELPAEGDGEEFQLRDAGGVAVTLKTLRDTYIMGKCVCVSVYVFVCACLCC